MWNVRILVLKHFWNVEVTIQVVFDRLGRLYCELFRCSSCSFIFIFCFLASEITHCHCTELNLRQLFSQFLRRSRRLHAAVESSYLRIASFVDFFGCLFNGLFRFISRRSRNCVRSSTSDGLAMESESCLCWR